jgi:photosystem II stability/assembly factor-like uncharacterized protein
MFQARQSQAVRARRRTEMKATRVIQHLSISLIAAAFALTVALTASAQQRTFENENEQQLRQQAFWRTHRDSQGRLRPDLWRSGIEKFLAMRAGQRLWFHPVAATDWLQIGPQPLRIDNDQIYQGTGPDSGEVVDIAIDPSGASDQIIYIATNDGGIWKTIDGGMHWAQKTDTGCPDGMTHCPSLSMGAVAISPQDTSMIFAGTGNPFDGGLLFTKGVGIYRSGDGGDTWTVLNPGGIFTNVSINRIAAGVYYSASITKVALLVATGAGLFRSIDSGDHFGNNPPNFDNGLPILGGYITDLKIDTPIRQQALAPVYAAVQGMGIYKSYNGGVTFPVNLFDNPGAPMAGTYSFVSFAIAWQTNKQRMYASVEKNDGTYLGLYRSDDGGLMWMAQTATNLTGGITKNGTHKPCQCGYDQTVGVDPQDWDRVYVGFQELWLSTDGGATFGTPPVTHNLVHWDHHAIYFSPQSHWGAAPTRLWVGEDGGVASSMDGGTSWDNFNETIATNLYYHIDVGRNSPGNIAYTYGGTQDTGTNQHRPDYMGNDWHLGIDGDGSGVGVDPFDPTRTYAIDNGSYIYTTDGGDTWVNFFNPPPPPPIPSVWRYAIDRNDSDNVFAIDSGGSGSAPGPDLYRSTDKGVTFNIIDTFVSNVSSIANTPINSKLIWLGMNDGTLQRCNNALGMAPGCTAIADPSGTGNPVGGVFIVLTDPSSDVKDRVIAVYEGMNGAKHVYYTTDSGATWKNITNTVPDLPTHSIYGSAAIANDAGVMFTDDLGSNWRVLGPTLPTVDSTHLAGGECPPVLRLGTYGRSVWELSPSGEKGFYDNGPVNGEVAAWSISQDWVSDYFRATGSSMQGVTFYVWVLPMDVPASVIWIVSDEPDGGSVCETGNALLTPTYLFTNVFGFDVYKVTFDTPMPVPLNVGGTYFLTLLGALTEHHGPMAWDQNDGVMCMGSGTDLDGKGANCPSYGFTSTGSIPSESFKITTAPAD